MDSLRRLQKRLELPNPLEVSSSLSVSLITNQEAPLSVNIRYEPEEDQVWIDAPITYELPSSSSGLQDLMIKLFNDLIVREKKIGRLVASPDKQNLTFVKSLKLSEGNLDLLADFIPVFIEEASLWRKKLENILNEGEKNKKGSPREILDFSCDLP